MGKSKEALVREQYNPYVDVTSLAIKLQDEVYVKNPALIREMLIVFLSRDTETGHNALKRFSDEYHVDIRIVRKLRTSKQFIKDWRNYMREKMASMERIKKADKAIDVALDQGRRWAVDRVLDTADRLDGVNEKKSKGTGGNLYDKMVINLFQGVKEKNVTPKDYTQTEVIELQEGEDYGSEDTAPEDQGD